MKNPTTSGIILTKAFRAFLFTSGFILLALPARSQSTKEVGGVKMNAYHARYFKPHRGLFYSIYLSPLVTVDPLGLGGKSTYGAALGTKVNLWESMMPDNPLTGLKIKGLYAAVAYEYYPKQYDKVYGSLWIRIKAFIPLAGRLDYIYAYGNGLRGITSRYCVGFELGKVTIFVAGELYKFRTFHSWHPNFDTPYTNAGEIMAVIPVYSRRPR